MVNLVNFDDNIRYDEKEGACGKEFTLKAARAEHDMTQGDLAEAVGATRQTIGLIEAGVQSQSSLCIAICKTLDRTLGSTVLGDLEGSKDDEI